MTVLCRWGLRRKFHVYADRINKNEKLKKLARKHEREVGAEWLYDFTCLKYDSNGWLKQTVATAECEWGDTHKINYDFQKLLLSRADVRVIESSTGITFVMQEISQYPPNGLSDFRKYITNYKQTCTGDTYLFAARLHEDNDNVSVNHRFDYHLYVA